MPQWLTNHGWRFLAVFGIIAVLGLVVACGGDDDDNGGTNTAAATTAHGSTSASATPTGASGAHVVTINAGDPIIIGTSGPLSGDLVALGQISVDASTLAAEQFGQVKGHDVQIKTADDLCDSSGAEPAAQQLLAIKGLVGVIGAICSGVNTVVQPIFEEKDITQISPSSTAPVMTYPEGRDPFKTFLRTIVSDATQGKKQAEYATQVLNATTAFDAHDTDTYGTGLEKVFKTNFTDMGGTVVDSQGFEKGQTDFSAMVTSVTDANPDLVYVASFDPEAAALIRQLRDAGYTGDFLAGDGVITAQFLTLAGDAAEGAVLSKGAPIAETPALTKFATDFMAKYNYAWDAQPYGAESYDAYHVFFNALTSVAVDNGGKLTIDLDKLNDAIHAANFDGISGHMAFDDHGDVVGVPGKAQVTFSKVVNGAYVLQDFQ